MKFSLSLFHQSTTNQTTTQVDLFVDRLPRLPAGHNYKCVFNRSEQTSATQTATGLTCPLPKLMDRARHIQIEPGRGKRFADFIFESLYSFSLISI